MEEEEMFWEALEAVYEGKAVMTITILKDARVISLAPINYDSEDEEEEDD